MNSRPSLAEWLAQAKRLHAPERDRPLDGLRALRDRLDIHFAGPVIVVAGTNGKGSTCALLESIALAAGYRVGLYSQPHLVRFEERCRIGGQAVPAEELVADCEAVEQARQGQALSWHEFTTLAILHRLARAALDIVILEVGLGGRLDAVNVIDGDCAVITSVALDHMDLLGPDRESIGAEKAAVMRAGRPAILCEPQPPASVLAHAGQIGADVWRVGRDFNHAGDRQQWNWAGRGRRYAGLAYPALRGANQLLNAAGALAALEALRPRLPITAQAVRVGLAEVVLPGRFQVVPGRPVVVLDVAHNEHAVATLALNLDAMGFHPRTLAVFGTLRDKAVSAMLARMLPRVDAWHLAQLPGPRAATTEQLAGPLRAALQQAGRIGAVPVRTHGDVAAAVRAALAEADPADRIVVFGSFLTVGGVLKEGLPRLAAPPGAPDAVPS